jgi:hypothetical protein
MSKPRPSDDECLLLIVLKRKSALAAMRKIVSEFGLPPHKAPNLVTVLEYLTNMSSCVELMLKFLSGDWRSHKVGDMYEAVFGGKHPNQRLMDHLKTALVDQKYLFEPNGGLLSEIEDFEKLHDELKLKIRAKQDRFQVFADIPAPDTFLPYLRDNPGRFYGRENVVYGPGMGPIPPMDLQSDLLDLFSDNQRDQTFRRSSRQFPGIFQRSGRPATPARRSAGPGPRGE